MSANQPRPICPCCGETDHIGIEATITIYIGTDGWITSADDDWDYTDEAATWCETCGHCDTLAEFPKVGAP